jgi:uncharacterized membrane protein
MGVEPKVLVAILLMGAVIYAARAGGLWLASRVEISGRVEAWLNYLPGAILVSIVAPTVLTSGPAEALAALAVVLVALRSGGLLLATATGVVVVVALRAVLGA